MRLEMCNFHRILTSQKSRDATKDFKIPAEDTGGISGDTNLPI